LATGTGHIIRIRLLKYTRQQRMLAFTNRKTRTNKQANALQLLSCVYIS